MANGMAENEERDQYGLTPSDYARLEEMFGSGGVGGALDFSQGFVSGPVNPGDTVGLTPSKDFAARLNVPYQEQKYAPIWDVPTQSVQNMAIPTITPEQNASLQEIYSDPNVMKATQYKLYGMDKEPTWTASDTLVAGLPTYERDGQLYYDPRTIAREMGLSDDDMELDWLLQNQPNYDWYGNSQLAKTGKTSNTWGFDPAYLNRDMSGETFTPTVWNTDEGQFLQRLAQTRAFEGAPIDLSNERHIQNIMSGRTVDTPWASMAEGWAGPNDDPARMMKNLDYKEERPKWYNAPRLVPMIGAGIMSLAGGVAGGAALGPVIGGAMGAAGGTGLGGAVATGIGAGIGGSAYSALQQGTLGKDVGGALKTLGTGAVIGGVTGGLSQASGLTDFVKGLGSSGDPYVSFDSIPMDDPMHAQVLEMATQMGTDPQSVLDLLTNLPQMQQLSSALGPEFAAAGATDIFGRNPSVDYGPQQWSPDQMPLSEEIRAFYNTGNTGALDALGYMTDTGFYAGLTPSGSALDSPSLAQQGPYESMEAAQARFNDKSPWKDILSKALGLYQPDVPDRMGRTGFTNSMFTPQGGNQAQQLGLQSMQSSAPDLFSQQMQMVKDVQSPYTQDLMSLAMENPDILEDPTVRQMLESQIAERGVGLKRFGLDTDPLMGAEVMI